MKKIVILLATLVLAACGTLPEDMHQSANVNGNTLTYAVATGAAPTVVLEAGLGDGLNGLGNIHNEIREFASVFSYARAGYGSDNHKVRREDARTAKDISRDLRRLLSEAGVPTPYLLVGHSIGGLYMMEFARMYPDLVSGLVLIDARLPEFTQACEAAGHSPCAPPAAMMAIAPKHVAAEIRGIQPSERYGPSAADIGNIPTVVLAATKPPPGAPAGGQEIWLSVQRQFASELNNGRFVLAQGAGHYIQRDKPELVINAIRSLLENNGTRQ